MSTIKLKGSSSGEAEVTVAAAAGTPTFTLPTTVGSANQLVKNSGTAGTLQYTSVVEDSNGKVGIGETSPSTLLHLKSGSNTAATFQTSNNGSSVSTNYTTPNRTFYTGVDIGGVNSAYTIYDGTAGAERLRVESGGAVTKPNHPSCSAYWNGNTAVGGNGAMLSSGDVAIANNTRWNIGSHYNTSNGRFTCPVDGKYQVTFRSNLRMVNLSVGDSFFISVYKNGAAYSSNYDKATQTNWQFLSFTNLVDCSADDYVDLRYGSDHNRTFGTDASALYSEVTFSLIQ